MKKNINITQEEIVEKLVVKIANLEVQLATEQTAREAVMKYAEELEQKLEKYENESAE